jgi:hypothetical protein
MEDVTIVAAKNIGAQKENGAEKIRAVLILTRQAEY